MFAKTASGGASKNIRQNASEQRKKRSAARKTGIAQAHGRARSAYFSNCEDETKPAP